ncbi:hypothetical protein [Pseudomonas sp. LS-2]|uniref:hypothetical protein n=1 Tax=Pseudomonas sp. LS-2 TaxID=2315859 RepID=UPI000E769857|nr:hypothetical protein [Pseudomonas sp. LS-2]RJX80281.1 hypothetical protein D3M70_12585 [Pseudomonas sp. LS-2]
MIQPKERPILFSAPMVRAIREGRKTVTRRVVKVQPFDLSWSRHDHRFEYTAGRLENGDEIDGFYAYTTRSGGEWSAKCPYGQPGDRLWVRETFADLRGTGIEHRPDPEGPLQRYAYAADCRPGSYADEARKDYGIKWKPSIHMPRAACRIQLEITAVRVERLQAGEGETASESRYVAEGIHRIHHGDGDYYFHPFKDEPGPGNWGDPFDAWRELWVSINGAESWNANPWVWVVEFKRVTP